MALTNDTANYQDFEQAADHLRQHDLKTWQLYNKVSDTTGLEEYEKFQEAAAATIKQIQAKQGALYTDEGKRALIREELQKLANQHIDKAKKTTEKQAAALDELKTRLADDIARGSRVKDTAAIEQLQAQARTDLSLAANARSVEIILRELVDRGSRDRTAAQFVATYGYLFAERVTALAADYERAASLVYIQTLINQAKPYAYSETVRAKLTIQSAVQWKDFFSSPSVRFIEMSLDGLLKKY